MPRRRASVLLGVLLILVLAVAAVWFGRTANKPDTYAAYEMQRPSALKSIDDFDDRGTRYESVDAARADLGYDFPVLDNPSLEGIIVIDDWDAANASPDRRPVIQFYDGVRFEQWPHDTAAAAQAGLAGLASINEATGINTVEPVTVSGCSGYLDMNATIGGGESQLSWVKGEVFYSIRTDQRETRETLLDAADSAVYP